MRRKLVWLCGRRADLWGLRDWSFKCSYPLNVLILCREDDEEESESDYVGAEQVSGDWETVPLNVLILCREEEEEESESDYVGAEQISGEPSKDEVGPTPFYTWAKKLVTDAFITYITIENIISCLHCTIKSLADFYLHSCLFKLYHGVGSIASCGSPGPIQAPRTRNKVDFFSKSGLRIGPLV
jgi:hypothetical protein